MRTLSRLDRLEAESIHIIREAIAESEHPVLLYSIGKDSSVLVHLALKAFYPAKPPFPLLHIDTTWKFRDLIAFRDRRAEELGFKLIVHINQEGVSRGATLFRADDDRLPLEAGERPAIRTVRFRTLGCYPLTGAIESSATSLEAIIRETAQSRYSERCGRLIDHEGGAAMERKKQE